MQSGFYSSPWDAGVRPETTNNSMLPRVVGATLVVLLLVASGCQTPFACSRRHVVSDALCERMGNGLGPGCGLQGGSIPACVDVADGLTEDEIVALTLWNNAAYHELLAQLGVARGQLLDAGLLTDPQLIVLLPVGVKQLEWVSFQFVDALWLQPVRVRAAELDLFQLAEQMIQNGLDVARDARIAHAELLLAQQRAELTARALGLRNDIAALAERRLDAGEISELEATSTRIEALQAEAIAASAEQDVQRAQITLRNLIGVQLAVEQMRRGRRRRDGARPDGSRPTGRHGLRNAPRSAGRRNTRRGGGRTSPLGSPAVLPLRIRRRRKSTRAPWR